MGRTATKQERDQMELRVAVAQWYMALRETNNETFMPLFFDQHKFLVLMGGGGSGKSIFAGRKVLERCSTEPGHRWLVCRKTSKSLRQSCFRQLVEQAMKFYPDQVERVPRGMAGDMYIKFRNGSEILFSGLDDVEKLKSIYNITGIWIEECSEIQESDFNQLDIRLRGETKYYKQIIISFNPISVTHWLKKRFFDKEDRDARTHTSTYKDNRFLPEEDRQTLEKFRETDIYYYNVYALGQWGITGKTVFDAQKLQEQLARRREPVDIGYFEFDDDGRRLTNIRWVSDHRTGFIKIYQKPGTGIPYVIGGDTAGEGSDWFVGQVIDNTTGRLVATMRQETDEDLYARQMVCLGWMYNEAMISCEINFSTHPQKEMQRLGYHKFYIREREDDATQNIKLAYGFRTSQLSRPAAIAELKAIIRDHVELIDDYDTITECMSFVRSETGRPQAADGAHDDTVIALAIAYYSRGQQRTVANVEVIRKKAEWTADMWDDWRRADAATRAMLEAHWGSPR